MRRRDYIPRKQPPAIELPDQNAVYVYERLRNGDRPDTARMCLKTRLKLSDRFVETHPGRPISGMLMDLFPDLEQIPWSRSGDE